MKIQFGNGRTEYGPGVTISLTGDEVAIAIEAYLMAHNIHIRGSRTIRVNGELCNTGSIYVDPSGKVMDNNEGKHWLGRGVYIK